MRALAGCDSDGPICRRASAGWRAFWPITNSNWKESAQAVPEARGRRGRGGEIGVDGGRRVRMRSRVRVRASSPLLRSTQCLSDSLWSTLYTRSLLHSQHYPGSPSKLPSAQSDDSPRLLGSVLRSPSTPNTPLGAQSLSTTEGCVPCATTMTASLSASQTCYVFEVYMLSVRPGRAGCSYENAANRRQLPVRPDQYARK
jgi:hypothetical protein